MLTIIVTTLLVALTCNIVLKTFNLPSIIGYIITGTIIAYCFGLHDAVHNHELKEIAEFGVVFLMFTIGLEFSFKHLKRMKYEVFIAGSLQIVITAVIVYLICLFVLKISSTISLILALSISLSSTAIVLKTFNKNGEINKRHGQRALGILIMQDIAVIPILLLLGFLSSDNGDVVEILIKTAIDAVLLLGVLLFIGRFLLERFFKMILKTHSDELFMGSILFLAIGSSYLAHMMGFSYSLGAFIAGMLISETRYKHQAEADLVPFRDLLLGIFFITVGMQIDFAIIFTYIHIIFLVFPLILVLKFCIIYGIVRLTERKKTSFKTALSLVQVGEFSLAVLELARSKDLIVDPYGQVMIVTIVLSMILTPIILKYLTHITDRVIKSTDEHQVSAHVPKHLRNHVVILGYGEFGQTLACTFKEQGIKYVIVEKELTSYHKGVDREEPIIFGNALKKEVLKNTAFQNAKKIIVAIDNPAKLNHMCQILLHEVEADKLMVKVHRFRERRALEDKGITHIIVENQESSNAAVASLESSEN